MIAWLLSWLFPLTVLMPRARALGSVTFQTVEGVGWMVSIRPPYGSGGRRVNAWSGQGSSMARALRDALREAAENPTSGASTEPCAPKLGGAEFDED